MRIQPRWWIGCGIFLAYCAWMVTVWTYQGIDYSQIGSEQNLVPAIILPLAVAALLLAVFNSVAGWWKATLFEPRPASSRALLVVMLLLMLGFIGTTLATSDLSAITGRHLLLLGIGTLLVGFCEEMVTRGVLLVSLRGSLRSEAWAWFWSSALFGLLHAINALFGLGALAIAQVAMAFCVGTGLYLLRRLSGTLLLPIAMHMAWDFSTFANELDGTSLPPIVFVPLVAIYLGALVMVAMVLHRDHIGARRLAE